MLFIQCLFVCLFQHCLTVWREDSRCNFIEAPQHYFRKLQMDWVWWGIPAETCGVSCTGWSRSHGSTCFRYLDSKCFFTLFYLMWLTFSPTQPLDLEKCCLSIHIFTLNDDGPSTLTLEEDEELSAANHWLLPAGDTDRKRQEGKFYYVIFDSSLN